MKQSILLLLRGYRVLISPIFPPSCRFYPSCSDYTSQAVSKYGAGKGVWLGLKRLLRCHPFDPGGIDELN
ncbi:MAG: membrane protein insertion efficiency factor YidD [Candidatus Eisenbacteria bacterium]|nr:membrane protein insertion efficiency factor YidD [Candidatus Eisenbacteria bacterium]